jgi:hypothetical protein
MKKYVLSAVTLILAAIAGVGWYVYQNAEELGVIHPQLIPPDYYWLDDPQNIYAETGIVEIAGREFKIPVAYVDGRFKNGRMEGSVVLEYVLPDFRSKLEFGRKEERMKLIRAGRMRGMLLEESAVRPSFDVMIHNLGHGEMIRSASSKRKYMALKNTAPPNLKVNTQENRMILFWKKILQEKL